MKFHIAVSLAALAATAITFFSAPSQAAISHEAAKGQFHEGILLSAKFKVTEQGATEESEGKVILQTAGSEWTFVTQTSDGVKLFARPDQTTPEAVHLQMRVMDAQGKTLQAPPDITAFDSPTQVGSKDDQGGEVNLEVRVNKIRYFLY